MARMYPELLSPEVLADRHETRQNPYYYIWYRVHG